MPRYFFHVHDGRTIQDKDGTELPDLETARKEAVRLSGRLLLDNMGVFWNGEEWRLDVADEWGLTLFTMMFLVVTAPAMGITSQRSAES